jgi:hypothetical protein
VQDNDRLVTVPRHAEPNALCAGLARRADVWPQGSLAAAAGRPIPVLLFCVCFFYVGV